MGLNFLKFMREKSASGGKWIDIQCQELAEAAQEYQIRELSFWICANMIANAIGRCDFRTFRKDKEIFEREAYIWNVEPNKNQNSTEFLHKLIAKLFAENEALIIGDSNAPDAGLLVADEWDVNDDDPRKENKYKNIVIEETKVNGVYRERDVIHLKLNHVNMHPIINGLFRSYIRLVNAAIRCYEYDHGQHWKVHVNQMAAGDESFAAKFQNMIQDQLKPFFASNGAVLPEFDGYQYTNVGSTSKGDSRDVRNTIEDIFDFTARGFLIPAVLVNGKVEGTADANKRLLTNCVDPICDQLQEEITRKRYGYTGWKNGEYLRVDSSAIVHFDVFENAPNVEKLVGSGAYTINDVLRAANQPRINEPWANEHYLTLNIAKMSEATRALTGQEGG